MCRMLDSNNLRMTNTHAPAWQAAAETEIETLQKMRSSSGAEDAAVAAIAKSLNQLLAGSLARSPPSVRSRCRFPRLCSCRVRCTSCSPSNLPERATEETVSEAESDSETAAEAGAQGIQFSKARSSSEKISELLTDTWPSSWSICKNTKTTQLQ